MSPTNGALHHETEGKNDSRSKVVDDYYPAHNHQPMETVRLRFTTYLHLP